MCDNNQMIKFQYLAAMTGIHGVNSSLWLPISQSDSGKRQSLEGVMGISLENKNTSKIYHFVGLILTA